jgi:Uma2 family endonuclease
MNATLPEATYTPEDLLALGNGHRFELIDGRLKERPPMGAKSNRVATIIVRLLDVFTTTHGLGLVFSQECGYQIFPDKKKVRKPDFSFIARGKLADDQPPEGHVRVAPDLIGEVISPNDLAEDVEARVADYLGVGVKQVWLVYPSTRSVYVLRPGGAAARLTAGDERKGDDVLPGFACRVEEFFSGLQPS